MGIVMSRLFARHFPSSVANTIQGGWLVLRFPDAVAVAARAGVPQGVNFGQNTFAAADAFCHFPQASIPTAGLGANLGAGRVAGKRTERVGAGGWPVARKCH